MFLSNEETVARKNKFLRWQNEAVMICKSIKSQATNSCSFDQAVLIHGLVSSNYIYYCFVFQEWSSKQRQLSQMEYLQTGVLRTSEGPREGACECPHPRLVPGTKPDCRKEGVGFGSGPGFLRWVTWIMWQEKGMTQDEMVGWYHRLNGHEFEQVPRVGDEQGSLACCSAWGRKGLDTTEPTELNMNLS